MLAAALVLPACDSGESKADGAQAQADGKKAPADGEKAPANGDEHSAKKPGPQGKPGSKPEGGRWQKKLDSRVLASSGLGVGGKLSAFQILNCEDGEEYCQVCRYGGNPKLMAVGTADDEAFRKDLKDLDAIVKKYGDDKVKAFAVVTSIDSGKAITPADAAQAQAQAKALKEELGVSFPIVVPAPEDGGKNKIWEDYYNITASRTVMFSDGRNEVKWSAVAPEDFAGLGEAIESVIGT